LREKIGWNGTRDDMMEAMSSTEFINWQAYFELQARDEEAAIEEAKRNAR